jgi:glycosyltransferase involved in cell wall biosynthesis
VSIIALLATYNEERFIEGCLEHLVTQGVEVYVLDNESTDQTLALARRFLGQGIVGIETIPRRGMYRWKSILERKEQLALELDADWFMHADPDEIRLAPNPGQTLAEAFVEVAARGFNAVNFSEFTFVPTRQSPDHDHADYERTMRWYYPFSPSPAPHQIKAWKKQSARVALAASGGHRVDFPGLKMYPTAFPMRHYMFLSVPHAVRKYVNHSYDPEELALGWHRARASLRDDDIVLQDEATLRLYESDARLDGSRPLTRHPIFGGHHGGDASVLTPEQQL